MNLFFKTQLAMTVLSISLLYYDINYVLSTQNCILIYDVILVKRYFNK